MLQALPLVFVLAGLALYTVLGGADFGAGFWQLFAGGAEHAERVREYAHRAMAPVWEANHVWLIFVLTVFWTCYPTGIRIDRLHARRAAVHRRAGDRLPRRGICVPRGCVGRSRVGP